ncbi:MAG: hypothetical protein ACK4NQ_08140, partial [Fimbriimonadaceae bacterium]
MLVRQAEFITAEVLAQRPLVERKLKFEGTFQAGFQLGQRFVGKSALAQGVVVDARGAFQRACTDRVLDNGFDLLRRVAKFALGHRDALVDDLEVTTAGELLEFHEGEVRLDARGVTVHDQA